MTGNIVILRRTILTDNLRAKNPVSLQVAPRSYAYEAISTLKTQKRDLMEVALLFYQGIYYETAGTGETAVFLHGWGGGIASFKGTFTYLSKFCRCVNLEFPGFGQSETPPVPYSVYDYAERIRNFIGFLCNDTPVTGYRAFLRRQDCAYFGGALSRFD